MKPKLKHALKESVKNSFLIFLLFDAIFIGINAGLIYFFYLKIKSKLAFFFLAQTIRPENLEQIYAFSQQISSAVTFIGVAFAVSLIVLIFSHSLTRTLAWNLVMRKKSFKVLHWLKFTAISVIQGLAFILIGFPFALPAAIAKSAAVLLLTILYGLLFYFFALVQANLARSSKIGKSLANGFLLFDWKFCGISLAIFFGIGLISTLLSMLKALNSPNAFIFVSIILVCLYTAWIKSFVANQIRQLKK